MPWFTSQEMDPINFPLCTPRKNFSLLTPSLLLSLSYLGRVPLHRQPEACRVHLGPYPTSQPPLSCIDFSTFSSSGYPTSSTFAKWYLFPATPFPARGKLPERKHSLYLLSLLAHLTFCPLTRCSVTYAPTFHGNHSCKGPR